MYYHTHRGSTVYLPKEHVEGIERKLSNLLVNRKIMAMSIHGRLGIGKSTTLSALFLQKELRRSFSEGIFFRSVCNQSVYGFCDWLVEILKALGLYTAKRSIIHLIKDRKLREQGLSELINCLAVRKVLLIIDDVNQNSESGECVTVAAKFLARILDCNARILWSSSEKAYIDVLNEDSMFSIHLDKVQEENIICKNAATQLKKIVGSERRAFDQIYDKCDGVALFYMLVGRAVKFIMENEPNNCSPWQFYLDMLMMDGNPRQTRKINSIGGRKNLREWKYSIVRTNARIAEAYSDGLYYFPKLFVLSQAERLPPHAFRSLWDGNENGKEWETILWNFKRLGILNCEDSYFVIHEFIHNVSLADAQRRGEKYMESVHGNLVDNYRNGIISLNTERDQKLSPWWIPLLEGESGKYLKENVIRHLSHSKRIKETISFLDEYRWTEVRTCRGNQGSSLQGLLHDIDCFKTSLPKFSPIDYCETPDTVEEIREGLTFLAEAASNASEIVSENPKELAFQMYGRLAHRKDKSKFVRRYLLSIDRRAEALRREEKGVLEL